MTSNALAAMGLCITKASPAALVPSEVLVRDLPSPQHVAGGDEGVPDQRAAAPHCPQDDPGAQARTGDVPTGFPPLIVAQIRVPLAQPQSATHGDATANDAPEKPLYSRLSRLLL